jgi:LysR family transcriptional regulator, cyn operon transcriptional activator
MELYQLRGFVTIARMGNLTKAAEKLNLTQPALSIQIKQLEAEFGEALFERIGRGLKLSPVGKKMLPRAEQVISAAAEMKNELEDIETLKTGNIMVGSNDSNCLQILPQVIAEFRNLYPGVQINLNNSHSKDIVNWVKQGSIELGIVTIPAETKGLTTVRLYQREDVLIFPPGHPLENKSHIDVSDLTEYPLLVLNNESISHQGLLQTLEQANALPAQILHVGSIEVIKKYTEIGLGISVIPRLNVTSEESTGELNTRALSWLPKFDAGVIYAENRHLSPAAREFLKILTQTACS